MRCLPDIPCSGSDAATAAAWLPKPNLLIVTSALHALCSRFLPRTLAPWGRGCEAGARRVRGAPWWARG
eukprot:1589635-Pleurochrysis_carterae.AAC.1